MRLKLGYVRATQNNNNNVFLQYNHIKTNNIIISHVFTECNADHGKLTAADETIRDANKLCGMAVRSKTAAFEVGRTKYV